MALYHVPDLVLLLGFALRLTRLVTGDALGLWFIREPVARWYANRPTEARYRFSQLFECPYCIGFWISAVLVGALAALGGPWGPGDGGWAALVWRVVAGAFTLSWVVGHIAARVGDVDDADPVDTDDAGATHD